MSGTHWITLLLAVAAVSLGVELMLSDDGYRKTRALRVAVEVQRQENEDLRRRNQSLDAEVIDLKRGVSAAEERARTDLGFIGRNQTFYQVVPAQAESP